MSKTIEEIRQYFEERPELRDAVNEELSDEHNIDSLCARAMDKAPNIMRYRLEYAIWAIVNAISVALESIDHRSLGTLPMGEDVAEETGNDMPLRKEFREWFVGERKECEEVGFKGFNSDMTCLKFQYEVGKEYEVEGDVWMCDNGFHACKSPLDVLRHYDVIDSRYCIVKQWGYMDKFAEKTASSNIKIEKEISPKELFDIAEEKMEEIPCKTNEFIGEGDWKVASSFPYEDAIEGENSNIILRDGSGRALWVLGECNIIGIRRNKTENNISGCENNVYIFGDGNTVNITGRGCSVKVIEGEENTIVVSGRANEILSRGKVNVVCTGEGNSVISGTGSTVTFNVGGKSESVVVDGKKIKEGKRLYFWHNKIVQNLNEDE